MSLVTETLTSKTMRGIKWSYASTVTNAVMQIGYTAVQWQGFWIPRHSDLLQWQVWFCVLEVTLPKWEWARQLYKKRKLQMKI